MIVTVYTMPNCQNCVAAKQLMQRHGMEYKEVCLATEEERQGFYQIAGPAIRQMPQIYINDERIGGFTGLNEWIKWRSAQ